MSDSTKRIVRPSEIGGLPAEDVQPQTVMGSPARKYEWEKALLARSRAEGMTAGCQHVALLLSTYADGDGLQIRPTVKTLATVSGKGESTIKESLKYLRDYGWILQLLQGQTGRASEYRLTIPPRVQ